MFRQLLRQNQLLPQADCVELLKTETRGVLSVLGDEDYPYGTPMNHWYNEDDGCIYFHCGKVGHRLDALSRHSKASFCVFDRGFRREGEWALNVKSVIVLGKVDVIDDMDRILDITAKLSRKFTQDGEYIQNEQRLYAAGTLLLRLTPEHICGKLVNES